MKYQTEYIIKSCYKMRLQYKVYMHLKFANYRMILKFDVGNSSSFLKIIYSIIY